MLNVLRERYEETAPMELMPAGTREVFTPGILMSVPEFRNWAHQGSRGNAQVVDHSLDT